MNTNKVKDPPHLGFRQSTIQISCKQNDKFELVLKQVERTLNIYTSTPTCERNLKSIMDISFSKCYQNVTAQMDNDSGYVSQNQESNSDLLLEGFTENGEVVELKSVYLCEDALQERPELKSQPEETMLTPSDVEKMLGTSERIEASVSTVSEHFSVLRGSIESENSDLSQSSVVISEIAPIIIYKKNACKDSEEICDISDNSNIENNINILNISNSNSNIHSGASKNSSGTFNESTESAKSFEKGEQPSSPDLFSDEDLMISRPCYERPYQHVLCKEKYVLKQDEKLIRNAQSALSGVLPPPSLTIIHLTVDQILEKIQANKHLFWSEKDITSQQPDDNTQRECANDEKDVPKNTSIGCRSGSLLLNTTNKECVNRKFPEIMEDRYHGLHHNRSKLSEDFETLCMKYAERYVGCETQSTCVVFQQPNLSSPMKRKANKLRWAVKSPGRRLSHLAKRRITFSSANLQAASAVSGSSGGTNAHTRQIAVDSRRFQLLSRKKSPFKKSPRKTPRKSPRKKIRTPSSSAKKRLSLQLQSISKSSSAALNESRASSTKRALFQSPEKSVGGALSKPLFPTSVSGTCSISPFKKRTTPKCALFTSPSKNAVPKLDNNKRKRTDSEDSLQMTKLCRSVSMQEAVASSNSSMKRGLSRVKSDLTLTQHSHYSGELSAHHRKKLQWAVYEALRSQNIGINHPQFKQFASVLARVTKRFLPNLSANVPRPEGGTSERMLRIARQHIYAVIKGKSVDEIVHDFERNRVKNLRPSGYVGLDGGCPSDVSQARSKETVFKDKLNTMSSSEEKRQKKSGLNREELIKTTLPKLENRVDRARRMINFDDENRLSDDVS